MAEREPPGREPLRDEPPVPRSGGRRDDDADRGDPLAALGAAWRELAPPATGGELARADHATRAAVEWMRAAWEALEVPAPRLPAAAVPGLAPRRDDPEPAPRPFVPLLAAAAVILLLGAVGWLGALRGGERPAASRVAENQSTAAERVLPGPGLPLGAGAGVSLMRPDRIEMRAGNVRLVLLTDPPARVAETADEARSDR